MARLPSPDSIRKQSVSSFLRRIEALSPPQRAEAILLRQRHDVAFFAQDAIPEHCRLPFSPFHERLFALHHRLSEGALPGRHGQHLAIAAPRGSAKSTIVSLLFPLHDLCFQRERYMVLLSATERQAQQRLREIRNVLRTTKPLFPLPLRDCSAGRLTYGDCRVDAYGAGMELRGISHDGWRPTKIILDDVDPSRAALSERLRQQLADWYNDVVGPLGDVFTHHLIVGTILHSESLLSRLVKRPDFDTLTVRAVEHFADHAALWAQWLAILRGGHGSDSRGEARRFFELHRAEMLSGAVVLWPEKEDYEELMAQLHLGGRRAFFQEKQNLPQAPEDAFFDPDQYLSAVLDDSVYTIHMQDTSEATRAIRTIPLPVALQCRVAYLDTALGRGGKNGIGDFSALAVIDQLHDGTMILRTLRARRLNPSAQTALLADFAALTPIDRIGIEANGFQRMLFDTVSEEWKRRALSGRIEAITQSIPKRQRIAQLEPLLLSGRLILSSDVDEELHQELRGWPQCEHDDALDAIAGAVSLCRSHGRAGKISQIGGGLIHRPF